jgi:hypothetical protein
MSSDVALEAAAVAARLGKGRRSVRARRPNRVVCRRCERRAGHHHVGGFSKGVPDYGAYLLTAIVLGGFWIFTRQRVSMAENL